MNEKKMSDAELRIMNVLWEKGSIPAIQIAKVLTDEIGYRKTTTYTLIKRCIDKGYIERIDPGFVCKARITKNEIQNSEVNLLVEKIYDGKIDNMVLSVMENMLNKDQIKRLKEIIENWED